MTQDSELVGIGLAFIMAAAVMYFAVNGSIDFTAMRWEYFRLAADVQALVSSIAASLPL